MPLKMLWTLLDILTIIVLASGLYLWWLPIIINSAALIGLPGEDGWDWFGSALLCIPLLACVQLLPAMQIQRQAQIQSHTEKIRQKSES